MDVAHGAPGSEVEAVEVVEVVEVGAIDGQQKRAPARVVALPFYDPEKKRVRA